MEIFQYIHEYTELNKGLKDLNKYNIFKKKKIVNEMNDLEDKLNTIAYVITIIVEAIYIYVTNKKDISNDDKNTLVRLGRDLLFLVATYFVINAFVGLSKEKNESQIKQVIASILVLLAALTRLTIKNDDITFR